MPRLSNEAKRRALRCHDAERLDCPRLALYLVSVAGGSFYPYCREHMTAAVTRGCHETYVAHEPGHRLEVRVLPTDVR